MNFIICIWCLFSATTKQKTTTGRIKNNLCLAIKHFQKHYFLLIYINISVDRFYHCYSQMAPCVVPCDAGWELNGTKCYNFSSNGLNWTESRDMCQSLSADLVKIESREEQKFMFNKLKIKDRFWIGLTDSETEGQWKWTDGSALDQSLMFWNMEPDDYDGINPEGEDCVVIVLEDKSSVFKSWGDVPCNDRGRFICEKEPNCK
uniref:C-type lectin domain-containing protein n=1 Tax=Neogobius melanostomus TaxID=47308 RepID=A0A8C6WJF4_9GOBI